MNLQEMKELMQATHARTGKGSIVNFSWDGKDFRITVAKPKSRLPMLGGIISDEDLLKSLDEFNHAVANAVMKHFHMREDK